jgi:hypothetical protein
MNRRLGSLVTLVCLAVLGTWPRATVFAQGLPAPGPGGTAMPGSDGGNLMAPMIIVTVALVGALVLAVAIVDLRRKRRTQAIAIEGQIADALMREPRLRGTVVTTPVNVPLTGRVGPTVEVRGEVEYPELREVAVRIVRQELLRHHPEGVVEDRIFVSPPVPAGRR